jgi:hypothetical protein
MWNSIRVGAMRWGMGFANPHDDVSHRLARWVAGMRARQSETSPFCMAGVAPDCIAPTTNLRVSASNSELRIMIRGELKTPLMLLVKHEGRLVIIDIMGRHPLYHHD